MQELGLRVSCIQVSGLSIDFEGKSWGESLASCTALKIGNASEGRLRYLCSFARILLQQLMLHLMNIYELQRPGS